jgi:hypothetical protein
MNEERGGGDVPDTQRQPHHNRSNPQEPDKYNFVYVHTTFLFITFAVRNKGA